MDEEQDDISKVGYSSGPNHFEIKADGTLAIDAPNGPRGELVHIYIPSEDFETLTKYMED
jgi:hypothetical protein